MTYKPLLAFFIVWLICLSAPLHAQTSTEENYEEDQDDNEIHTEVISVSKSFNPTVRKARRIKPPVNVEEQKKVKLLTPEYEFKSFLLETEYDLPSISEIKQNKKDTTTRKHNYIHFGMGNYISPEFNGFGTYQTPAGLFDIFLKYHSAEKSDEKLLYSNAFSNLLIDLKYKKTIGSYELFTNLNLENNSFSYFGINDTLSKFELHRSINSKQAFNTLSGSIGISNIKTNKGFTFDGIGVNVTQFKDDFSNSTLWLSAYTGIKIPIQGEHIETHVVFDKFTNQINLNKLIEQPETYNKSEIMRVSLNPNFEVVRDKLKFDLGLRAMFRQDEGTGKSNFEIYPNVEVVYAFVEELHIGFASIRGEMQENTFWSMSQQSNKFFSPINAYGFTSVKADITLGVKGLLMPQLSYKFDINAKRLNNRHLTNISYNSNNIKAINTDLGYLNANSGTSLTDTAWVYSTGLELNYNTTNSQTGIHLRYTMEKSENFSQEFASSTGYNINLYNKITFNKSWTWINEFYVQLGRNFALINADQSSSTANQLTGVVDYAGIQITDTLLDDLYDLNTQLWYTFKQDLSIFLKLSNFIDNRYQILPDTRVIGFQVFSGLTYQF